MLGASFQMVYPLPPIMAAGFNAPMIAMNGGGNYCISCGMPTESVSRQTLGFVACAWIVGLLLTVPMIACIPCCCDNCKDIEVVCVRCGMMKNRVPAYCCG